MSFSDPQFELAGQRIEEFLREADHDRQVLAVRRARARRRRQSLWRRVVAPRLASTIRAVNDLLGAIISPAWPSQDTPTPPPLRPSSGR
jgi:hypothetical protein